MELSFWTKLRIWAVLAVGVVLIGILAWPMVAPGPYGVLSVTIGSVSFGQAIILALLAVITGLLGYFVSWPYSREVGILAVPAGLGIWAFRCGEMRSLLLENPTVSQQQQLFAALKWEPFFWLLIVAMGFLGVVIGQLIAQPKFLTADDTEQSDKKKFSLSSLIIFGNPYIVNLMLAKTLPHLNSKSEKSQAKTTSRQNEYLNILIALVGSFLIAQFCIGIFTQNVKMADEQLGTVVAQPAVGQIALAVTVSFAIAAFVVKKFLNASYIWPIIASSFVMIFSVRSYVNEQVFQRLVDNWPPVFFYRAVTAILPIQIVSFAALGAIAGYWLAVRYNYWRKHEIK
ncbi:hypothetical protein ACFL3G_05205 [Planctomycetota bacterium]